ncbi:hypothetical protein [Rheinheimera fenheensis]|uniref:hypothetical protein n=1 Tax=Rheinheimera fenheensis TaxID=3152295 RepID=UPI003261385B
MNIKLNKGHEMEEQLRAYFYQAGYFVARGVPFTYEGFDITDIDLWLYSRASSVTREISIVDIKNKKTPQAIERIFWAKGLSNAVNADSVIVATTDKRKEVKDFGKKLNVLVLDGIFLSKLSKADGFLRSRLSDEEFNNEISRYKFSKIDGDWKGKCLHAKSLLAKGLSFDSCNEWLNIAQFFINQSMTKPNHVEIALRCFYSVVSMLCIGIDFILKELSFLDHEDRQSKLIEGFTYGARGKDGIDKMLKLSLSLVEQFSPDGKSITNKVRARISNEFSSIPTKIIGEYFSKSDVGRSLFNVARDLDSLAMARAFEPHTNTSIEIRSLIGCLLDFWSIDRVDFAKNLENLKTN